MKTHSLFNLAVKIFGIYFFVQALLLLSQGSTAFIPALFSGMFFQSLAFSASILGMMAMDAVVGWILMRYSRRITDYFVSPEEDCSIAIPPRSVISIALIFLGGWLVIQEIPSIFSQLAAFNSQVLNLFGSIFRLATGIVLVVAHRQIAEFIDRYAK